MRRPWTLVIDMIRRRKDIFAFEYGVRRIVVFGSVVRNEAIEPSDVDFVDSFHTSDTGATSKQTEEALYRHSSRFHIEH